MEEKIIQQNNRSCFLNLKIAVLFLLFSNLLYLLFIMIIGYHNIPQADDFCFIVAYKNYGFFGSFGWWYTTWQGRFMPYLFINFFLKIYENFGTLFPYTLFITFVYILAIHSLLKKIIATDNSKWERLFVLGLSLTIFNTFLLFHFDTSTFFWINVSTMYFGGVAFFLLGVNQIFSKSKGILSYAVLIFSFLYAGSSSEHFGLITLILLGVMIWFVFSEKKNLACEKRKIITRKLLIALLAGAISFLIMYLAPGNNIRRAQFPHLSIVAAIKQTPTAINYLIFLMIPARISYLFIALFSFFFAGSYFGKGMISENISKKLLIIFCCVLAGIIVLTQFLFIYAQSHSGPSRAYVHLSMLIVIAAAGIGFMIGGKANTASAVHYLSACIGILSIFLVAVFQIKSSLYPTLNYVKSVNERLSILNKLKNTNYQGVFKLDSLKVSERNFLLNAEIAKNSLDSNNMFINNCIEAELNLKFKIELKEK